MPAAGLLFALFLVIIDGAAPQGSSISGRVTDKTSGQPLPRIVVTLYSADRAIQAETVTDKEGRYEFADLAGGKYTVGADNDDHVATYLRQWYGVDQPATLFGNAPPPNVEIARGELRANVDLVLTRALAIEGHVFDPVGEALRDIDISVTYADGNTPGARMAKTDDQGAYRVYGLASARYRVCAAQLNARAPQDDVALARTCYPDMSLMSQDSFNIDIHMQRRDASDAPPDAPAPLVAAAGAAGSGAIRGVIIDKQSGRPVARATVRLGFRGSPPPAAELSTATNADGVFFFRGLTPGRYDGFATAAGHLLTPLRTRDNNGELTVLPGQTLQISLTLPRAYSVTLRLVDAFNTPVAGVGVSASVDGRPVAFPFQHLSDDLGRIRVPELAPGRYVFCAEPADESTRPPSVRRPQRDHLLRTCYPSAATDAESQPVVVEDADLDAVEIRIARGRTLSISGTVVDSAGSPAAYASVELRKVTRYGTNSRWFRTDASGSFRLTGIQPDVFAISATLGGDAAFIPVTLENDDLENVVIAMQRTVSIAGRVVGEDPSTVPPTGATDRAPLQLTARLAGERLAGFGSSVHATMNSDGTFALSDLFGRRTIDVQNAPTGWYVKSIRYGTRDVTDTPTEFKDDRQRLEIVLSRNGATLGGTVADVIDKRVPRALVLLLAAPADNVRPPRLVGSVMSISGNYSFGPLREGDYVIIALPSDVPTPGIGDWDRLAQLAALGERVTLADLDQRTIDLRVTPIR